MKTKIFTSFFFCFLTIQCFAAEVQMKDAEIKKLISGYILSWDAFKLAFASNGDLLQGYTQEKIGTWVVKDGKECSTIGGSENCYSFFKNGKEYSSESHRGKSDITDIQKLIPAVAMNGAQIKSLINGRTVRWNGGFSLFYDKNGDYFDGMKRKKFGTWAIKDNQQCATSPSGVERCYNFYKAGNNYISSGSRSRSAISSVE